MNLKYPSSSVNPSNLITILLSLSPSLIMFFNVNLKMFSLHYFEANPKHHIISPTKFQNVY